MPDIRKAAAETSVKSLSDKLQRCIDSLKKHVTPEGRLDDYDQHAVRILESRQRFLERLYLFLYGSLEERETADIELNRVAKRDDGTLVQLGEKKHGQGRMDCRACDRETYLDGNGVECQRIATQLCISCFQGIQHTYVERTKKEDFGTDSTVQDGSVWSGGTLTTPHTLPNDPASSNDRESGVRPPVLEIVQHKVCDHCRFDDRTVIGYESEVEEPQRWRTMML